MVPCHHLHAKYLPRLCESYAEQTNPPEEIVISLSGCSLIKDWECIDKIKKTSWPFKVRLILSNKRKTEPQNKNIAAKAAKGDVLICQDADDIPHPQRVEIIKYFFNTYDIVHLIHAMSGTDQPFSLFKNFDEIKYLHFRDLGPAYTLNFPLANGPIALLRSVFKKIQWDDNHVGIGSDLKFNRKVYKTYRNNIIILAKIYRYYWSIDSVYLNYKESER